jgi:hypothetical protein
VKRSVSAGELGIHQFYSDAELPADARELAFQMGMSEAQFLQGLVIAYLQEMNVEPGLAAAAARVPPEEMHYITEQEIVDWRLDTDRPRTTPWIIEPYKNGAVFTSSEEDAPQQYTAGRRRLVLQHIFFYRVVFLEARVEISRRTIR